MSPWQGVNRFLLTYREALVSMSIGRTWVPFAIYIIIQGLMMSFLYFGVRPPLTDFLAGPLGFVIPSEFFTYPTHLLMLPFILHNRMLLPVDALLQTMLLAAATSIFVHHFRRESLPTLRAAWAEVSPLYIRLILFWVLNVALLAGSRYLFDFAFGDLWIGFARRRFALELVSAGLAVMINGLLAYSTIILVVKRSGFTETISASVRTFGRHWCATFFIVAIGTLVTYPTAFLMQKAPGWIARFNPEVLMGVLGLSFLSGALAYYLLTSALTYWYLLHTPE